MGSLNVGCAGDRADAGLGQCHWAEACLVTRDDVDLGLTRRQRQLELEQETVQLGLGQRVGALVLNRVLRRDHHERLGELTGLAVDRDGVLFHRLEEGRLGLRRRTVDLVREQQVREDGALTEDELGLPGVPHHRARDIGGHEVGGELDTRHIHVEGARQGAHEQRLSNAGYAFEERVTACDKSNDEAADCGVLADDRLADLRLQGKERLLSTLLGLIERAARPALAGGRRERGAGVLRGDLHLGCVGGRRALRSVAVRRCGGDGAGLGHALGRGAGDRASHGVSPFRERRGHWRGG